MAGTLTNSRVITRQGRKHRLDAIDGRSCEARLLRQVREQLTAQCGGNPSPAMVALIERAAMLTLRLREIDNRALAEGGLSTADSRQYISFTAALARLLRSFEASTAPSPSPAKRRGQLRTIADIVADA